MAITYEPIATTTLSSGASTITINSIPATYTDLRLILNYRSTTNITFASMRFNNDSGGNYNVSYMFADPASSSNILTSGYYGADNIGGQVGNLPINSWGMITFNINSYASTNMYKHVLYQKSYATTTSGPTVVEIASWQNLSAITRIDLISNNQFAVGTKATLFGILRA